MKGSLEILHAFNEKVARLERSGFAQKYQEEIPEVLMTFDDLKIENHGEGKLSLTGQMKSWVPDFDEDEIDAFVLTYRILTQKNDRLSLARVADIYKSDWMPPDAAANFEEARKHLTDYYASAATLEFGELQIAIRDLVDVVIYGGLAHTNPQKAAVFEAWKCNPAISGFIWVEFIAAMNKALYVFSFIRQLNEAVLEVTA